MKLKLFLSALFNIKNIAILSVLFGVASLVASAVQKAGIYVFPACMAFYLFFVFRSMLSKKFVEEFQRKERMQELRELDRTCRRLTAQAKSYATGTQYQKLRMVMEDKNDIMETFLRGEKDYVKEKIVHQSLMLFISYAKLLINYCIRSKEINSKNTNDITDRINTNLRKLDFIKDRHIADDLSRIVEMDKKLILRLNEEKKEIERISAKMDYIERTVNMLKHQIISSIESEEMLEKLDMAVNEAVALDSVLESRRKNRMKH